MSYIKKYDFWLNDSYFDFDTKDELIKIKDNEDEIEDRFYKELEFGTGGLRGIIGAGTNRVNTYTIRRATQGLSNYILKQGKEAADKGVAIAYDSRNFSKKFAHETAFVLNGNGIKTYLFDDLSTVSMLSFAVREIGCTAGIVITASHNPPEYNGYKVYWSDGGQVIYPYDEEIINEVNLITEFTQIKHDSSKGTLFNIVDKSLEDKFCESVKAQLINLDVVNETSKNLSIVYTPLHGSGNKPIRRILQEVGFKNVHIVKEQELPDPNFSTVISPNPEESEVFELALKLADKVSADIIIGTDPDADRLGVIVKNGIGEYVKLTGNEIGIVISEYILSQKKANGTLPKNGVLISTIVSTKLASEIARYYGVSFIQVLTGFKFIGEKIKQFEKTNEYQYIFGFEESYGYLAGTYVRDKDAVVSAMLICEVAAYYKSQNMSMYEGLQKIYEKYGFFKESLHSVTLKGIQGSSEIKKIMQNLRNNNIKSIGDVNVSLIYDYKNRTLKNLSNNNVEIMKFPISDVLYFELEDKSWFCVRPSGTEPKIKLYFGVIGVNNSDVSLRLNRITENVFKIIGI